MPIADNIFDDIVWLREVRRQEVLADALMKDPVVWVSAIISGALTNYAETGVLAATDLFTLPAHSAVQIDRIRVIAVYPEPKSYI